MEGICELQVTRGTFKFCLKIRFWAEFWVRENLDGARIVELIKALIAGSVLTDMRTIRWQCKYSDTNREMQVQRRLLLALGNALAPRSPDVKYYKYTNTNSNRKQTSLCFSYLFVVLVLLILRQIRHHCTYFFFSISFDIFLHYVYCLCSIYREFGHIMYGYVPFTERLSICDLGS